MEWAYKKMTEKQALKEYQVTWKDVLKAKDVLDKAQRLHDKKMQKFKQAQMNLLYADKGK